MSVLLFLTFLLLLVPISPSPFSLAISVAPVSPPPHHITILWVWRRHCREKRKGIKWKYNFHGVWTTVTYWPAATCYTVYILTNAGSWQSLDNGRWLRSEHLPHVLHVLTNDSSWQSLDYSYVLYSCSIEVHILTAAGPLTFEKVIFWTAFTHSKVQM